MSDRPRIAVIGAGLGGLIATIVLQRSGYDVAVYEQKARLERLGAGISLSPNVTRIFRDLDLLDGMAEIGVLPQQWYSKNGYTGDITFAVPVETYRETYGAPSLTIHRGDLQQSLIDAVAPDTIKLGKRVVDVMETADAVRLQFADGTTAEADIAIVADGINSRIRELLLGAERPTYTGEVAYRSIFPRELIGDLELPDRQKLWGDAGHIIIYYITHARDVVYFVTGVLEPDWGDANITARPADMNTLRAHFAGFTTDVMQVLEATPSATAWPVLERDPLPLWSRGRIVLLGDACHPMRPHLGQGAAMAMEDGVMLARCIDDIASTDPQKIFGLYEAQRRERTSRVQAMTKGDDWMRFRSEDWETWLYGYDVFKVPLHPAQGTPLATEVS